MTDTRTSTRSGGGTARSVLREATDFSMLHGLTNEVPLCEVMDHEQFLLVWNFSQIAFSCPVEPLRIANHVAKKTLYRWCFAVQDGAHAQASNATEPRVSLSFAEAGRAVYAVEDAAVTASGGGRAPPI